MKVDVEVTVQLRWWARFLMWAIKKAITVLCFTATRVVHCGSAIKVKPKK